MASTAGELTVTTEGAAFVRGPAGTIVSWNRAAERLLRRSGRDVVGRPCFEVLAGRDVFGNRHCAGVCPVWTTACRRETVRSFRLQVEDGSRRSLWLAVSIVVLRGRSEPEPSLLHLLEAVPADVSSWAPDPFRTAAGTELSGGIDGLTRREIEVLGLLGRGLGTDAIARDLGITRTTVRNHVQRCLGKAGAHSRLELVRIADRLGLTGPRSGP